MSSHDYKKKGKFNKNIKIKRLETNKVYIGVLFPIYDSWELVYSL